MFTFDCVTQSKVAESTERGEPHDSVWPMWLALGFYVVRSLHEARRLTQRLAATLQATDTPRFLRAQST